MQQELIEAFKAQQRKLIRATFMVADDFFTILKKISPATARDFAIFTDRPDWFSSIENTHQFLNWKTVYFATYLKSLKTLHHIVHDYQWDIHQENSNGDTLLHFAALVGDPSLVLKLIQDYKMNRHHKNHIGETCYTIARQQDNAAVLEALSALDEDEKQKKKQSRERLELYKLQQANPVNNNTNTQNSAMVRQNDIPSSRENKRKTPDNTSRSVCSTPKRTKHKK